MRLHGGRPGALGWRMSQAQGPVQARLPRPREEQALPKENPPAAPQVQASPGEVEKPLGWLG